MSLTENNQPISHVTPNDPAEDLDYTELKYREISLLLKAVALFAHEISQPLTVLVSNLDLLKFRESQFDQKTKTSLERMGIASQDLSDSIKRIQNLFQGQEHEINFDRIMKDQNSGSYKIFAFVDGSESKQDVANYLNRSEVDFEVQFLEDKGLEIGNLNLLKPDLLLLDFTISGGEVIKFIQDMQNESPEFPVAVLSHSGNERSISGLMQKGVTDYLSKSSMNCNRLIRMVQFSIIRFQIMQQLKSLQNK